jgi:hypothetical protein
LGKLKQPVLFLTILDGEESESEPILEAIKKLGLDKEYFVFISNKPYGFMTREDFAETMRIAMKKLLGQSITQTPHDHVPNPPFNQEGSPEE